MSNNLILGMSEFMVIIQSLETHHFEGSSSKCLWPLKVPYSLKLSGHRSKSGPVASNHFFPYRGYLLSWMDQLKWVRSLSKEVPITITKSNLHLQPDRIYQILRASPYRSALTLSTTITPRTSSIGQSPILLKDLKLLFWHETST